MAPTLLVDGAYRPVAILGWQKAVCLMVLGRAVVVEPGTAVVRSPSTTMAVPVVLRLLVVVRHRPVQSRPTRRGIFARDDHRCQYCGRRLPAGQLNLDHVIPRSRGGGATWENLVTCCIDDNRRKGGGLPREVGLRLLRRPAPPRWTPAAHLLGSWSGTIPPAWAPYLGLAPPPKDQLPELLEARPCAT